ncbi:SagB/ThcOx family dehydrogenase [Amycolatopsis magusensis]|uniref:SagB-type dehydrogenase family enzyme n=1 Tax=Amycolatopsis magusensis TaxID=882444 RepID=A0ABS4PPD5_9PSEU|nr:SagB-type dehydrogenase family enzyme [Amycolatopsis magusensis]
MADALSSAKAVHAMLNGQSEDTRDRPVQPNGHRIPLPDLEPPRVDLVGTLVQRRSAVKFADRPLDMAALSALLRFALGVQRFVQAQGVEKHPLGMAPSAGGLLCLRAYLLVRHADGVPPGIYRYESVSHQLIEVSADDPTAQLTEVFLQPEFASTAPVTIALTARLDVAFAQYPLRHYRTLHVDAGVAVQNLYTVGTALGLACCAVAAFDDRALGSVLCLPDSEIATMLFSVGQKP